MRRHTDDDWTKPDDPDYLAIRSVHKVDQHVSGIACKCLPVLLLVRHKDEPYKGIEHGKNWPVRVLVAERGHP